jgi:transcriptional regulator with XRE-family HTH domain
MGEVSYELIEEIMTNQEKTFYEGLGQRVAELRKQNNITQVELARELGVSQQQIASYEAGRVKIPVSALAKLAVVLATQVDELIGLKQVSRRGPSSKLQQQLDLVRNLPRSKQRFVSEMLDAVIQQAQQQRSG